MELDPEDATRWTSLDQNCQDFVTALSLEVQEIQTYPLGIKFLPLHYIRPRKDEEV